MPHRVVARLEQHALRAEPDRERQPGELAGRARSAGRAVELLAGSTRPPCAAARCPRGACRSTRPARPGRGAWTSAEVRHHQHAVDLRRAPAARRAAGSCPPRRGSSRPPRRARASCAWGGPRTRAPARAARRCRRRCRGRRAPRRRRGRPRSRSGGASGPARRAITFTSSRPAWLKRCSSGAGKPRASNWLRTSSAVAPVTRPARRAGRARARRCPRPRRRPGGRRTARRRPAPAAAAAGLLWSENMASTSASRAGTNAAL